MTQAIRLPAAERRDAILDAALPLFAAHGYAATSINEVVGATGVTKPVVYQHFGSKQGLYTALLEREGRAMLAGIGPALVPDRPLDERLQAIAEEMIAFVRARPDSGRLLFRTPEGDEVARDSHDRVRSAAADAAAAAILADPAFKPVHGLSRRAAAQAHGALQAAVFERLALYALEHPRVPRRALAQVLVDLIYRGLGRV